MSFQLEDLNLSDYFADLVELDNAYGEYGTDWLVSAKESLIQ